MNDPYEVVEGLATAVGNGEFVGVGRAVIEHVLEYGAMMVSQGCARE